MEDTVHSQDHHPLPIDEITSPLGFEFCESDLFPEEVVQNSEHASTNSNNNCCYEEQSSYQTDMTKYTTTADINEINPHSPTTNAAAQAANDFSIIFDDDQLEHDISASIDFSSSPSFSVPHHNHQYNYNNNNTTTTTNNNNSSSQEPFNVSSASLNNHLSLGEHHMMNMPLQQYAPLPTSYEDNVCLPPYIRLRSSQPTCSLVDPMMPPFFPQGNMSAPFSAQNSGIFTGNGNGGLMLGTDLSHQELDFQGDNGGLFLPDNLPRVFNCSSELQTLSSESQHLVHGGTSATPLASEISSFDDPTFKVGKLSVEERKRKIDRYMQKRNERNFSKKIKYACRKTLADSRPRVRGRFAKNDELGEIARATGGNHEDDIDDDVSLFSNSIPDHQKKVGVKEDDLESADIFAHISGVNSFKCNYPIQSWI